MAKKAGKLTKDINFIYEIGSLRFVERTWRQFFRVTVANNADHMFRVAWISLILARHEEVKNEEKIVKMALLHDIAESRAPDTNYISKIYSSRDEDTAMADILRDTALSHEFVDLYREYEERKTLESKIVKDADNLDVDFEIHEHHAAGHMLEDVWFERRKDVRDGLFTETAKQMWDELYKIDPNAWHVIARDTGGKKK